MHVSWTCKAFGDLSVNELYDIVHLRNEVFVIEQQCVFQDADYKDQDAFHLMGYSDGKLAAYTRLLPAGVSYKEASIGRVVTAPWARNKGLGKLLMNVSINYIYTSWGRQPIRIGAQVYLRQFYESLGFIPDSGIYIEDGIEHMEMLLLQN